MVAAVAELEPLTEANRPQETIVVAAVEPGKTDTRLREKATRRCDIPPAVRKSPVATKSGTARNTYTLIVSLAPSPIWVTG